ncbi:MAG: HesA/MoeB/ThiF family protein [Bacteroidota bacterium]
MIQDRYSRQTSLAGFGAIKQAKLAEGRILVVGLGGLGLPVVQYLNAMGAGTIGLVDQDVVELHNLQRQVLYNEHDIGRQKLDTVVERLKAQNSTTGLKVFDTFLTVGNALEIISGFDVVVDATDNFATRYLINDACVILDKPFVYGALHGYEGQVSVFNYQNGPTYRCLFPDMPSESEIPNCDENGVLGVVPGIIGTLQAFETVKVLTGIGNVLSGTLLLYNGLDQATRRISFKANPENKKISQLLHSYGHSECVAITTLSAEQFRSIHTENHDIQLIDVRSPEEYAPYHLDRAINIPLPQLDGALDQLDFEKPLYLICQSGKRSAIALRKIKERYPDAPCYHISGGVNKMMALCR